MTIFDWEKQVIEIARTWPTSGPLYDFFHFWTDYSESRWLALLFMVTLSIEIGWKKLIVPSIFSCIAVALGDLASRRIVKAFVMRPRPNYVDIVCNVGKCWGFVSSHATNISAVAVFLCLYDRRNIYWAFPVVTLVCFSRIYLIDHFPLDVIGGMVLGAGVGVFIWFIFKTEFAQKHIFRLSERLRI